MDVWLDVAVLVKVVVADVRDVLGLVKEHVQAVVLELAQIIALVIAKVIAVEVVAVEVVMEDVVAVAGRVVKDVEDVPDFALVPHL